MTDDPITSEELEGDDPADGATWLLDLVAAVDHLRRGLRPGLTVWDALEEALRSNEPDWDDPDPLRTTLHTFLASTNGSLDVEVQAGIRRWVLATAERFNDGHHWPHPAARRGFPAPSIHAGS
jgi:hypothetical protein